MNKQHQRTCHEKFTREVIGLAGPLFLATTALAQNCSTDWFTIDGGACTSTGGVYSVSGTIGQPDPASPGNTHEKSEA